MTGRRGRESGSRGRKAEEEEEEDLSTRLALPALLEPGSHLAPPGRSGAFWKVD